MAAINEERSSIGFNRPLSKFSTYVTLREAMSAYARECEARHLHPRGLTQVNKYLAELEKEGFVDIKKDGPDKTSRVLLTIADVQAGALVMKLESISKNDMDAK